MEKISGVKGKDYFTFDECIEHLTIKLRENKEHKFNKLWEYAFENDDFDEYDEYELELVDEYFKLVESDNIDDTYILRENK